jgi:crotonobetainyl-CoA:carnitine CoA-transferase CaiB-like acyl-CoA transferase
MSKLLEGIKVLDLSANYPGPYCTLLLSDLGADVIKIEVPALGDLTRSVKESFFQQLNRGKKSFAVNLKNPAGREAFLKLAKGADVILESFRPGVVKKLGIDYDAIRKINDQIIYCSISSFGQDGPTWDIPCHDLNIIGLVGVQDILRTKNGDPVLPAMQLADATCASLSAVAILSAVWQRTNKKKGQYLVMSMYESCMSLQHFAVSEVLEGGEVGAGMGMLNGGSPQYNVYRTSDGKYISVASAEPHFWAGVCKLLGREDLAKKQFLVGEEGERATKDLQKVFLTKTLDEWMGILGPAKLCVAPVLSLKEAIEYPQAKFRNVLVSGGTDQAGLRQLNCPIKGTDLDEPVAGRGPRLGEHNMELLIEAGMTREEIKVSSDAGAFEK